VSAVQAAVVDYGAGNIVSITQAIAVAGAGVRVARTADQLAGAVLIVVPGVGASGPAMKRLRRNGLDRAIREAIEAGAWYLGVCLGLQLLYEASDEDGTACLGFLEGRVAEIRDAPRLPHIGWNTVDVVRPHALMAGLPPNPPAYFVHSYAPRGADSRTVVAETEYGSRFPSVVAQGRLLGVQFHPERSGADGLTILRNAVSLASGQAAPRRAPGAAALAGAV
jgi:imidazole glycerol-phosphate synthase subunit HisH